MISRIHGIIHSRHGLAIHVTLPGTGLTREVLTTAHRADLLADDIGQSIEFLTIEYLESQGQGTSFIPRLIGFATPREKHLFELLTTVKGIGNRKALRAMASDAEQIAHWIARRDVAALTTLPEIGRKLAETIIAELASKIPGAAPHGEPKIIGTHTAHQAGPAEQAIAALIALGDARTDAETRVRAALAREPDLTSTETILAAALAGPTP